MLNYKRFTYNEVVTSTFITITKSIKNNNPHPTLIIKTRNAKLLTILITKIIMHSKCIEMVSSNTVIWTHCHNYINNILGYSVIYLLPVHLQNLLHELINIDTYITCLLKI